MIWLDILLIYFWWARSPHGCLGMCVVIYFSFWSVCCFHVSKAPVWVCSTSLCGQCCLVRPVYLFTLNSLADKPHWFVHKLALVWYWMLIILLGRFIQTYGTHIIVGMAVGGQDLICVRQKPSSAIPPADLRRYLEDLGDYLFSDGKSPSFLERKTRDGKQKVFFFFK